MGLRRYQIEAAVTNGTTTQLVHLLGNARMRLRSRRRHRSPGCPSNSRVEAAPKSPAACRPLSPYLDLKFAFMSPARIQKAYSCNREAAQELFARALKATGELPVLAVIHGI